MSIDISALRQNPEYLLGAQFNDTASAMGRRISVNQANNEAATSTRRKSSLKKLSLAVMMGRRMSRKSQDSTEIPAVKPPPAIPVENTYQLGPNKKHFTGKVTQVINETLQSHLTGVCYDGTTLGVTSKLIADYIKSKVKAFDIPRYKIVCLVCITSMENQGFQFASRSLWDHQTDNYASGWYQNESLCASATVYWVYLE